MRLNWSPVLICVAIIFAISLVGCGPKNTEIMQQAEQAIAEAEAAGAADMAPVPLEQAKQHLAQGKQQDSSFRFNIAKCEYEAAIDNANVAKSMAEGGAAQCPECEECEISEPTENGSCCLELNIANDEIDTLRGRLSSCRAGGGGVVTRTVYRDRDCPETDEPVECPPCEPGGGSLLGTLTIEPPKGLEQGRTDYQIKAIYTGHPLGGQAGSNDWRILIDIADLTGGVDLISPMAQHVPLQAGENQWMLSMNVPPEGVGGPVDVTLTVSLWNAVSNEEVVLPDYSFSIPDLSSCPESKPCPPAATAPAKSGSGMGLSIIMLLVGCLLGGGVGFFLFGRKKKSSI